jgi:hypothetical protein
MAHMQTAAAQSNTWLQHHLQHGSAQARPVARHQLQVEGWGRVGL